MRATNPSENQETTTIGQEKVSVKEMQCLAQEATASIAPGIVIWGGVVCPQRRFGEKSGAGTLAAARAGCGGEWGMEVACGHRRLA